MRSFYFNGLESIRDMGVYIVNNIEFPNISEKIEQEPIDGSPIGSLTIKTGEYEDSVFTLKLRFIDRVDIEGKFKEIKNWLKRVKDNRLSFDYEKCYKVKNIVLKPYKFNRISGEFEVDVVCEPHLKAFYSEYTPVVSEEMIYNNGDIESYPKLKITLPTAKTSVQIYINNEGIQLKDVSDFILIDSERQIVVDGNNQSKTINMTGDFPILKEGENIVRWTGNITKFEINKNERFDC